jgi:DNA polymerase-3 subunit delta'
MQFQKIIGQHIVKERLVDMSQQNRLSHALLFLGREGSGALGLAIAFAQYLVCERNSPYAKKQTASNDLFGTTALFDEPTKVEVENAFNDACGICPACVKAQKFAHPDIHFSYPVFTKKTGDKPISTDFFNEWREFAGLHIYGNLYDWLQFIGAENKQGNITAEECRDINRKLNLKSFESRFKILICWMPEKLTKEGNRLLKLIEEPPPDTLFIFVAENAELILPTILSRTQLIKIPSLSDEEVSEALQQRSALEKEKAAQIALLSEGNYREAQLLAQHPDDDWLVVLREWMNVIVRRNLPEQVKWIEEMAKQGRERQKQFLKYFTQLLEQAIRMESIPGLTVVQTADADFSLRINKMCSVFQKEAIIHQLDSANYYVERNANPKLLFHALSIKLYHIICNNSLILVK